MNEPCQCAQQVLSLYFAQYAHNEFPKWVYNKNWCTEKYKSIKHDMIWKTCIFHHNIDCDQNMVIKYFKLKYSLHMWHKLYWNFFYDESEKYLSKVKFRVTVSKRVSIAKTGEGFGGDPGSTPKLAIYRNRKPSPSTETISKHHHVKMSKESRWMTKQMIAVQMAKGWRIYLSINTAL